MSEQAVPEGVDPETGEVLTEDALDELEEAESDGDNPTPDSDEPGPDAADNPAPDDSPEAPEPEPGPSGEAQIEANTKALNRAAEGYIKKVVSALGPDLEGMQTCPLCAETWPGLRFPTMPSPENLAAVRVAIGLEPGDNLPKDNYSRPCAACEGWGRVDTGSKVAAQSSATCYDCKGRGWVPVGSERESGRITAESGHTEPELAPPIFGDGTEPPEAQALRELGFMVVKVPNIEPLEIV